MQRDASRSLTGQRWPAAAQRAQARAQGTDVHACSPRTRGWSGDRRQSRVTDAVFPAHAGESLARLSTARPLPRGSYLKGSMGRSRCEATFPRSSLARRALYSSISLSPIELPKAA